jgi:hypothetical protein
MSERRLVLLIFSTKSDEFKNPVLMRSCLLILLGLRGSLYGSIGAFPPFRLAISTSIPWLASSKYG